MRPPGQSRVCRVEDTQIFAEFPQPEVAMPAIDSGKLDGNKTYRRFSAIHCRGAEVDHKPRPGLIG